MQMTVCKIFNSNSVNNVKGGWGGIASLRSLSVILLEVISLSFFAFSGFGIF